MAFTLVTARTNEPLNLDEVKLHLRVDQDADDNLIETIMAAVRDHAESITNRDLMQQTWDLVMDDFPLSSSDPIYVDKSPLSSVTSITYIDSNGDTQTWASGDYIVDTDSEPGRITPAYGESYPTTQDRINTVTVRFVSGYGTTVGNIPEALKQAMLLTIGHLYEHRETVVLGITATQVPMAAAALLANYRVQRFVSA